MTALPSLFTLIRMTFATLRQRFTPLLALSSLALIASLLIGQAALEIPERRAMWSNGAFVLLAIVQILWQAGMIVLLHGSGKIGVGLALRRAARNLWQLCVAAVATWAIAGLPLGGVLVAEALYGSQTGRWTVVDAVLAAALFFSALWLIVAAAALLFAPFRIMLERERGFVALLHSFRCICGIRAGLALRVVSFFLLLMIVVYAAGFVPVAGPLLVGLAVTPLLTVFSFHLFTAVCKHRTSVP